MTFLVTDIEGSTRLWQQDDDVMGAAVRRHDELVGEAIAGAGGTVFSAMGDGFAAAFGSAEDAARAATAAQERIAAEAWPTAVPIRVRMGLHSGVADERDGNFFGTAVNRAARLMAVGHGGQTLCSATTAALLGEASLFDLGDRRLRDLDEPMHVFQLGKGDFPPLRSLDAFPGNLPQQLSSFVGREREVQAAVEALSAGRLVTVTGAGGVGKTRFALQVGAEVVSAFAHGVWLCELAPVSDSDVMASVVAGALGCSARGPGSMVDAIGEFVGSKRLLLILDNCEHLLDVAAKLAERLLASCRDLVILATSREALDVAGEKVLRLRSLDVPQPGAGAEELRQVAASRLLLERAEAAGADVKLSEHEAGAVAEVCRRLDGIPLAIELAAARMVAMSAAEVAARLDERFRLLTGGRRAAVERHHTLRAAIDWSYASLLPVEQEVFDCLGVFPASFNAEAAQAVAAGVEAWDVVDALGSLVAKSLLVAERAGDGTTRYQMLESLRHYARERLDARGAADGVRRSHAREFAALSERFADDMQAGEEGRWNATVTLELDNLRAAVAWALDSPDDADSQLALQILAMTSMVFNAGGTVGLYAMATGALERARRGPARYRTSILSAASWNAFFDGDIQRAAALCAEAGESDIEEGAAFDANGYLVCRLAFAPTAEVPALVADGRVRLEQGGATPWTLAYYLANAVSLATLRGHLELARAESGPAIAVAERLSSPSLTAAASYGWALAWWQADPYRALEVVEAAPGALSLTPNAALLHRVLALEAQLAAVCGDAPRALLGVGEAVAAAQAAGDRQGMATVLSRSAEVFHAAGDDEAVATIAGILEEGALRWLRPLPPHESSWWTELLTDVAASLGEEENRRARRRGTGMTYQEIIAFAVTRSAG